MGYDTSMTSTPLPIIASQALSAANLLKQPRHSRPVLYLDLSVVSQQYAAFAKALPSATIHYAMKCNPEQAVLQHIKNLGGSFEIASFYELTLLLAIGVNPADVLYSNPVKSPQDIRKAYEAGVRCFAFQSEDELAKFSALGAQDINVYLRLSTPLGKSTVASEAKFGLPAASDEERQQAVGLLLQAKDLGLIPYGIAFHVGSQMEHPEAWSESLRNVAALMENLEEQGIRLKLLDIGGGFPAYHNAGIPPLADFGAAISRELAKLPYQPERLVIEPGRALVSNAGALVAEVYGKALRAGQWWLYISVGAFNGLMEALESNTELRYPMTDTLRSDEQISYVLSGPSCDSQDTISQSQLLSADIAVGDQVIIYTTGAYSTAYASRFNGFETPEVVVLQS
jgi:ornithine decarboxylase